MSTMHVNHDQQRLITLKPIVLEAYSLKGLQQAWNLVDHCWNVDKLMIEILLEILKSWNLTWNLKDFEILVLLGCSALVWISGVSLDLYTTVVDKKLLLSLVYIESPSRSEKGQDKQQKLP